MLPTGAANAPAVHLDGGLGNDDIESRQAGGSLVADGGRGDDELRTTLSTGLLRGGPGHDTCHLDGHTPHSGCEVVVPVYPYVAAITDSPQLNPAAATRLATEDLRGR